MTRALFNALSLIKVFGAALVMTSHYAGTYFSASFYSYGTGCFFVVAGYYALNWERSRGIYYVLKRLVRLYPAYLLAILVYLFARTIPLEEWPVLVSHHLAFLLTTSDQATVFALNPPFWSLPVFFTFFALVACLPRFVPRAWQVLALMIMSAAAVALGLGQWRNGYLELLVWPLHLYAFWLGGWLGHLAHFSPNGMRHRYTLLAAMLMVGIVVCGATYETLVQAVFYGETYAYRGAMVLAYSALFWCVSRSPLILGRLAVLNFLGIISFGVYLFHSLPPLWLQTLLPAVPAAIISVVLSMALAWFSWRYVEAPLQRFCKPRLARWHARRQQSTS
ncbi:acyltransferase family protein [Vreelandella jeotgali]|uniref:acyltransferase family protein n=1 Tax=Vreelandella jeotgali TaxID=553386 RepID=UPI00034CBAB6|nr:acyltransferase [Halomonas jeotgali]